MTEPTIEVHGELVPIPTTRTGYIIKSKLMPLVFCRDIHMTFESAAKIFEHYGLELDRGTYNAARRPLHGAQRIRQKSKPKLRSYLQSGTTAPAEPAIPTLPLDYHAQLLQASAIVTEAVTTAKRMLRSQPGALQAILQAVHVQLAS